MLTCAMCGRALLMPATMEAFYGRGYKIRRDGQSHLLGMRNAWSMIQQRCRVSFLGRKATSLRTVSDKKCSCLYRGAGHSVWRAPLLTGREVTTLRYARSRVDACCEGEQEYFFGQKLSLSGQYCWNTIRAFSHFFEICLGFGVVVRATYYY